MREQETGWIGHSKILEVIVWAKDLELLSKEQASDGLGKGGSAWAELEPNNMNLTAKFSRKLEERWRQRPVSSDYTGQEWGPEL